MQAALHCPGGATHTSVNMLQYAGENLCFGCYMQDLHSFLHKPDFVLQQPGLLLQLIVVCVLSLLAVAFAYAFIPWV